MKLSFHFEMRYPDHVNVLLEILSQKATAHSYAA